MYGIFNIGTFDKVTDTIWSSPRYHGKVRQRKVRSVVIIFAHRYNFRELIFTFLLEVPVIPGFKTDMKP